jgi:ABC-type thiamine transport system substrate-binding protein
MGYVSWKTYTDELCASFTSRFILSNEEEEEITGKVAMLPAVTYKELPRQASLEENLCTMNRLHMMGAVCDSYT